MEAKMGRLDGKRILVTGAATGIGRATAIRVASDGARVAAFDIEDASASATLAAIEEAGGSARYWHVDVTDEPGVSAAVDEAAEWMGGGIDALLHLAGILKGAGLDITKVDDAIWDPVIDVNVKGSYLVSKHVARYMKEQRSGVIVLTSSGAGVLGGSSSYAYGASKGGTHGLAMTLDGHLSKFGIRVHDMLPGELDTPLKVAATEEVLRNTGDRAGYERTMANLASPDGVAAVIAFLASDDADYVRGSIRTI
jgi:NAD(P)-dependent dehydrogenase (short-subunit alcohol dehydrogenase family)